MTPEQLEALMLDDSLGALSPEASALLAHYLADRPDLAEAAREYSHVVRRVEREFGRDSDLATAIPEFPSARIRREQSTRFVARGALHALSLAACVAFGFWIGGWIPSRSSSSQLTAARNQPQSVRQELARAPAASDAVGRLTAQWTSAFMLNPRRANAVTHPYSFRLINPENIR